MENVETLESLKRDATSIHLDYASGSDLRIKHDVDSMIISCRSVEPFKCRYTCVIYAEPNIPVQVKNSKFTKYMDNRHCFDLRRKPRMQTRNEIEDGGRASKWYEFVIGVIDNRELFVAYKMDLTSPFYEGVPPRSTTTSEGIT